MPYRTCENRNSLKRGYAHNARPLRVRALISLDIGQYDKTVNLHCTAVSVYILWA